MSPAPPFSPLPDVDRQLRDRGFTVLDPQTFARLAHASIESFRRWAASWDDLPRDTYLRDGGRYRQRRHSCFVVNRGVVAAVPRRPHYQSVDYNALHGGIERWFEPMDPAVTTDPAWIGLLASLAAHATSLRGGIIDEWFVEAHPFRITTEDGIGRPTPEGAHRDGVDLVAVVLVARELVKGGETRVFDAEGPAGVRFTLTEPWSALLLDDSRVIHESTPIQPLDPMRLGHRDTLVVTLRAGSFQSV